jgi:hypothetical protein
MTEEHNIETALFKLSSEIKARRLNIDARANHLFDTAISLFEL